MFSLSSNNLGNYFKGFLTSGFECRVEFLSKGFSDWRARNTHVRKSFS